jgi:phage nucleotide-binding protein
METYDLIDGIETMGDNIGRGVSAIIYGNPGVGKTTLLTTLPPKETLIVNTEAGEGPLLGTGINQFNVRKALEKNPDIDAVITNLYKFLRTKNHPFKYVAIDNISELVEQLVLSYTLQRNKKLPELKEHGDTAYKIREIVYNFRDLVYQDISVIFNAWETVKEIRQTDGSLVSLIIPMIGNKTSYQMCGLVDMVGRLETAEKTDKRWIRFGSNPFYLTKSQFKGVDRGEIADLPHIINKIQSYNYKGENNGSKLGEGSK